MNLFKNDYRSQSGIISGWMIATIGLIVLFVIVSGLAIWAFVGYSDQKNNVDAKVADAVSVAKKSQADSDSAKFLAKEKEPNRTFVGPDDYGRVSFAYPKTWSVYVEKDATNGGSFEAYLNPITVPPVSNTQQYALRVLIEEKTYDKVLATYDSLVKKGDLKSSAFSADGTNGTRLDGSFTKDIRGSAVILRIRDKTLTIKTDANTFKTDFDAIIKTIQFNQ